MRRGALRSGLRTVRDCALPTAFGTTVDVGVALSGMLPVTSVRVAADGAWAVADCDGTTIGAGSADEVSVGTGVLSVEAGAACCGAPWTGAAASFVFGVGLGSGAGPGVSGGGFCAVGAPTNSATAVPVFGAVDADFAKVGGAVGTVPGAAMGFGSAGAGNPAAGAFTVDAAAAPGPAACCAIAPSRKAVSLGASDAVLSVLMLLDGTPVPKLAPQVLVALPDTSCSDPVSVGRCVSGRRLPPKAANTPNSQLNATIEANKAAISRRIFRNMRPRSRPARDPSR
jgi:hypothetical protein